MASFILKGPSPLLGRVKVSGAKNEALKLISLAVVIDGEVKIDNVPKILDVFSQLEIFKFVGGEYKFANSLILNSEKIRKQSIVCDKARSLRASIVFLGSLLSRFGWVEIPFPGGCAIGSRPIDTHLNAFADLGAEIKKDNDIVSLKLNKIKAREITLAERSVSATENVLIYLASQPVAVKVKNSAIEPEIMALVDILNQAGARIIYDGKRGFEVIGSRRLKIDRIEVIPDRIEAGTFLIAFAATGGEGEIQPFEKNHLQTLIEILDTCGVQMEFDEANKICRVKRNKRLKPFSIKTGPYPEFATDLQPPMALIASKAEGKSQINETMFENRFGYLNNLGKMGLSYNLVNPHLVEITGPNRLKAAKVESLDLRAGITILIAATMAEGESVISGAEVIDRGYESIESKLRRLKVNIRRVND